MGAIRGTRARGAAAGLAAAAALAVSALGCASAPPERPLPVLRVADFEGNRVQYQESGSGKEALVFVHGWSGDHEVWRNQVAAFQGKRHLIAIDLIGHGESDTPKAEYSFAFMARSIDAVLRSAGVERAVLVGHSNGMPTIREFYRLFPQKTLALVDVDGTLRSFFKDPKMADQFVAMLRAENYKENTEGFLKQTFTPKLAPEDRERIRQRSLRTPQHVLVGTMEANLDPNVWKDDPISVPFLLLLAKQPAWEGDYQDYVKKLAPGAEWRMYEGYGHFLQLEAPEIVNREIEAFLEKYRLL